MEPPAMGRGYSGATADASDASAGPLAGLSVSEADAPEDALVPLEDMMKSEWSDTSEEALSSLARMLADDSTGRVKAAVAARPGLLSFLISMATGMPVGEGASAAASVSESESKSGGAEMTPEAAMKAAKAVLRGFGSDQDIDDEDEDEDEDEDDDGTGYGFGGDLDDGPEGVARAQHRAAVADLAACFMRRRVDVVRRTLASIALQQALDGSEAVRGTVLGLEGSVGALVATASGREADTLGGRGGKQSLAGAFRPAIATLRHRCIRGLEMLCDSADGVGAVSASAGREALVEVAGCDAADDLTRESARRVAELLA